MPRYRIIGGKIEILDRDTGKRTRYGKGAILELTLRTAKKFEQHLEPLTEDGNLDNLDNEVNNPESPREFIKIRFTAGSKGDYYDVINTMTGTKLNDKPLNKEQAKILAEGIGLPTDFAEEEPEEEDESEESEQKEQLETEVKEEEIKEEKKEKPKTIRTRKSSARKKITKEA